MDSGSLIPRIPGLRDSVPGAAYKKGDLIGGKYKVHGVLGEGGFGTVYLGTSGAGGRLIPVAVKTFKEEYLANARVRERFRKEARIWVELARGPCIVQAFFVDEADGHLFIVMEYVPPDEQGINSLDGFLTKRPPSVAQSLRWAIQFCHGMEYAYSRGVRCHRDIKPNNIMIGRDGMVKITDFGLAGVFGSSSIVSVDGMRDQQSESCPLGPTVAGSVFGTPEYMPPEQFTDAASCDERSDIYSFGIVLYQMAAGGRRPFEAPRSEMRHLHTSASVPPLDSPLWSVIRPCLEKSVQMRFQSFGDLRLHLEPALERLTGERYHLAAPQTVTAGEWNNRGISLHRLGYLREALDCFREALAEDADLYDGLLNASNTLISMKRYAEAIRYCDRALALDASGADAMNNRALCHHGLGEYQTAVVWFDRAIAVNREDADLWYNRGLSLRKAGRNDDAGRSYDKALELRPKHASAWAEKGNLVRTAGSLPDALRCYDQALTLDPMHAMALTSRGTALYELGQTDRAMESLDRAIEVAPDYALAWYNRGYLLEQLSRLDEAANCYDRATKCDETLGVAWCNWGLVLLNLGRHGDALRSFERALTIDPTDQSLRSGKIAALRALGLTYCCQALAGNPDDGEALIAKGSLLHDARRWDEAIDSYNKALRLTPSAAIASAGRGFCLFQQHRYEEAIRDFLDAVRLNPEHVESWFGLATSHDRLNHICCAIQGYERIVYIGDARHKELTEQVRQRLEVLVAIRDTLSKSPERKRFLLTQAAELLDAGLSREAIEFFDSVVAIDADCADAWYGKGVAEDASGQTREAIAAFRRFLEVAAPEHLEHAKYVHGRLRKLEEQAAQKAREINELHTKACDPAGRGFNDEAIRNWDRILKLDPRNAVAWHKKGLLLGDLGRHEEAVGCYNKALEFDPRRSHSWEARSLSLTRLGRNEESDRCWDYSLELDLDPYDAASWNHKGNVRQASGRYEEAIRYYEKTLELGAQAAAARACKGESLPSAADNLERIRLAAAWTNKGVCLCSLGRCEEAIRCYDEALAHRAQWVLALYFKGLALEELSRKVDAVSSYRQFVELGPTQHVFRTRIEHAQQRIRKLEEQAQAVSAPESMPDGEHLKLIYETLFRGIFNTPEEALAFANDPTAEPIPIDNPTPGGEPLSLDRDTVLWMLDYLREHPDFYKWSTGA